MALFDFCFFVLLFRVVNLIICMLICIQLYLNTDFPLWKVPSLLSRKCLEFAGRSSSIGTTTTYANIHPPPRIELTNPFRTFAYIHVLIFLIGTRNQLNRNLRELHWPQR